MWASATLGLVMGALAVTASSASAEEPDPDGIVLVGVEAVDPATITWASDETGLPIDNPLPGPSALALAPSPTPSLVTVAACTSSRYKVLYFKDGDATLYAACYTGTGTYTVPSTQIAVTASVVAVCPNYWSGYIIYHTSSGLHASTYRLGQDSLDGTCYALSSSGIYPDYYTQVYLSSEYAG